MVPRVIVLHCANAPNLGVIVEKLRQMVYDAIKATNTKLNSKTKLQMENVVLLSTTYDDFSRNVADIDIVVYVPNRTTGLVTTEENYRHLIKDDIQAAMTLVLEAITEPSDRPSVKCDVILESASGFFIDDEGVQNW